MGLRCKLFRVWVVSVLVVAVFGCGKSDNKQQKQQQAKNLSPTVSMALDVATASGTEILEVVGGNPNLIVINAAASDPEGQTLTYEWQVTSDLNIDFGNMNTDKLEFVAPDVKDDTVFDVSVTVVDPNGASAQATSSFTLKKVNNAPVINLDDTMSVGELSALTLASAATDADDDALTFSWSVLNDNGTGFVITDPSSPVLTADIGDVADNIAIELELTVTDDEGAITTQAVTINVLNDADAPTGIQIVSATATSVSAVTIDWLEAVDNVSNASQLSYNVHVSDQSGFVPSATTLHSSITDQFTTTVGDLLSDTSYYVIIEVVDNSGNNAFSKQVAVSTLAKDAVVNSTQKVSNVAPAGLSSSEVSYQLSNEEIAPVTGDIVVSTKNGGMLRKVTEVVVDGDTVTLQTEDAAVNEVYEQLDISTNIKLIDVSNDNIAARQSRLAQRGVRSNQVTSGGKQVSSATWVKSGLTIVDEKSAVVSPIVPVVKSAGAAGQISSISKASQVSNVAGITDEYQKLDEDNLRLQGPNQKLFIPGKLTQFEVSAQVIGDTDNKFNLEYFKLVKFTHPRFGANHNHGANVTEVQAGDGSNKIDLLFSWVPGEDHIDTENYEPYTAIFEAKIDKVDLLDANDVLKIEVDVYVGYELETKSNEVIDDDGDDPLVKLTADTNFSFEPTIDIKVDIESGKLVKAHAFVKGLTKFDATLTIESDGSKDLHGSKNLITRSFVKVVAPGGVPIIVRGKFKLDAEINGKAEGSVSLSHILESKLDITSGFAYDNGNWAPRTHFDPRLTYRIEGEAKAKVYGDVRLIPSLELFFYEAATGKIIVEPYLYAEAGVEGHYRSEVSSETGVDAQLDYRFTEMAAGIGAELKLRAALEIFDKTIVGWPSRDKDEYKTITLMAKTPVIGIPTISVEDVTNPLNVNSCLIELKATVTPVYKPFTNNEPSIVWQADSIGWEGFPLAANDSIWATETIGENEFYAQAMLTSKTDYDLRFGGHSGLGSWARQYNDLSIDFSPDDSSSLPTYWANRYGLSQALLDDDSDGLTNIEEFENCTVPNNSDSDGDEMLDGDEIKFNLNPLVNDAADDADKDGIPNLVEVQEGGDPNVANEAPIAEIIDLQHDVTASTLVLGVEASDPDGQIITYKWREEGTDLATIQSPTSSQTTIFLPIVEQDTPIKFSVTVEDNLYVTTTVFYEVVVPYIEPINTPPVAVIEAEIVDLKVLLDGAQSSDLEDDEAGLSLTYLWEQTSGVSVVLNDPNNVNAWFDFPIVEQDSELTFLLTVTDSEGEHSTATLKIQIDGPENSSPIADAGDDQVAESGQVVTITGVDSEDLDNDAMFYSWQQIDTSGYTVDLSNDDQAVAYFIAPTVTETTTLSFELSVTDNKGAPSTATVNVEVSPQTTDLEKGLIAYFPLNGDTEELAGITASIYEVGPVNYIAGAVAEGVDLDGSSSLIAVSEAPRATNQLTMSTWVNPQQQTYDEYTGGGVVINSPIYELSLNSSDNAISFAFTDSELGVNKVNTGVSVAQDEWSHVAVVFNGVETIVYLNGVEVYRTDYAEEMPGGTWPLGIGAKYIPVELGAPESGWYSHFNGAIDEVRLYDRAINSTEINALFAQQIDTTDKGSTLLDTVLLSNLEGTMVEIRGADESNDWVWLLEFTHNWSDSDYFFTYLGTKSKNSDTAFEWQGYDSAWQLSGNNLTISIGDSQSVIPFSDGEINLGESLNAVFGDGAYVAAIYQPNTIETADLVGHRLIFMGAPDNSIIDLKQDGIAEFYQQGSSTKETTTYVLNDNSIEFYNGTTQLFTIGEYQALTSNREIYGFSFTNFLTHVMPIPVEQESESDASAFVSLWSVDAGKSLKLNTSNGFTYDYLVDWGDGSEPTQETGNASHTYAVAGEYTVQITGTVPHIELCPWGTEATLKDVTQWGTQKWQSMVRMFQGCREVNFSATGAPDLTLVTDMAYMFAFTEEFNSPLNHWDVSRIENMDNLFVANPVFNQVLTDWDVSSVKNMAWMFASGSTYNQDLSTWNVSNVTNTSGMFSQNAVFNQDLSNWDVSSLANMSSMFSNASAFNGDISTWDVSAVTSMKRLFERATSFNGDLSKWAVGNVTNMSFLFSQANAFNSDISDWNVSSVVDMSGMFNNNLAFNGNLNGWNVSKVTTMDSMFYGSNFNNEISAWDVSAVTSMYGMFQRNSLFSADLSQWDVSSVTNMATMFYEARSFTSDLSSWNVSNVTNMGYLFAYSNMQGDISSWDVSNVTSMSYMFFGASNFNQDLTNWDVSAVQSMTGMFNSARKFNGDISSWNVSSVKDMSKMFSYAVLFNGDLSAWDVSSVINLRSMFYGASRFNSDLANWDVSSAVNMSYMFHSASSMTADLSGWDVSNVTNYTSFSYGANLVSPTWP